MAEGPSERAFWGSSWSLEMGSWVWQAPDMSWLSPLLREAGVPLTGALGARVLPKVTGRTLTSGPTLQQHSPSLSPGNKDRARQGSLPLLRGRLPKPGPQLLLSAVWVAGSHAPVSLGFFFFFSFERQKKLPFTGSLPRCQQWPVLGRAESGSWEVNPGCPREWQEPSHPSLHLLPPRVHTSKKLGLGAEAKNQTRDSDRGHFERLCNYSLHRHTQPSPTCLCPHPDLICLLQTSWRLMCRPGPPSRPALARPVDPFSSLVTFQVAKWMGL